MTALHTAPAAFDAQLQAGDPTITDVDLQRLVALRRIKADTAVTVADLSFALDRYEQLHDALPQIRVDAARAAYADLVSERDRDLISRLAGPDRHELFVRFGGTGDRTYAIGIRTVLALLALVLVVIVCAVVA